MAKYVTPLEFKEAGYLKVVNEAVLWPKGLALGIRARIEEGKVVYDDASFIVVDYGEPVTEAWLVENASEPIDSMDGPPDEDHSDDLQDG